ncbi:DUF4157 domain-containing protein [Leptolyngbyaceae cyanobacterium UHCC 1019]
MQTRSSLQRRSNTESSDRVVATIKPRPWGDEIHQQPESVPPQTSGFDFKNVDWFSHDPGTRPTPSVLRNIQAKLKVGAPNDVYEQEADRVAEQVMSTPDSAIQQPIQREAIPEEELQTKPLAATITPLVQREMIPEEEKESEPVQAKQIQREMAPEEEEEPEPVQAKLVQREMALEEESEPVQAKQIQREMALEEESEPVQAKLVQREMALEEESEPVQAKVVQREMALEEEDETNPVQTKRSPDAGFQAGSNLENRLSNSQGGGSPLPDEVRSFMEPRFGADFSQVKVHTGSDAVQMNQDLNAQAFTHGSHIYYGAGKAPAKDELTGHELTHVVQQKGLQRKPASDSSESAGIIPNPILQRQVAPPVAPPVPATPPATPSSYHNAAAIYAMTLNDFDSYARNQADWSNSPAPNALSVADKRSLRTILEFGRSPNILNGCGTMTVQSLKDKGIVPTVTSPLRTYSRAVAKAVPTVELHQTDDINKGMDWGKALQKLEPGLGGAVIQTIIKEDGSQTQLQDLISANKVDALVNYNRVCHPVLHANNGSEIDSFLSLHGEGANPISYQGRLHQVRNFHRFEKAALDRLVQNQGNTSKAKPLALILHSTFDHNGAFHRDPNLTAAITDSHNLTLMLEGRSSLAEIQGELRPLARRYGRNNRISQVMIAGHGNARVMELAGRLDRRTVNDPDTHGQRDDAIDLDGNARRTQSFFQALLQNMESGPNARIVLNACLTASNTVPGSLDPDPARAQQQINQAIATNPSLATHLQNMATAQGVNVGVRGSNASFGQVGMIDPVTGLLDIIPAGGSDPAMTADKFTYVREGREPEGAMRAVVECWAQDQARCLQAVRDRQSAPYGSSWDEKIIQAAYGIVLSNSTNANLMNQLAQTVGGLSELKHRDECRVGTINRILPAAHLHTLFTSLASTSEWAAQHHIPLVVYQVWQKTDPSKRTDLLNQLQHFNCLQASTFVDTAFLGADLAQILLLPPASPPPANHLKLALIHVTQGGINAGDTGREYLRSVAGGGRTFPAGLNINGLLAGLSTEQGILQDIGLGAAAAASGGSSAPLAPAPNVDLDGDGTNDFYIESMTRRGGVTVRSLRIRARPNTTSAILGGLSSGHQIFIIGEVSNWYGIEFGNRTAFVYKPAVQLLRTP